LKKVAKNQARHGKATSATSLEHCLESTNNNKEQNSTLNEHLAVNDTQKNEGRKKPDS
jgi:hypothetical protein